MSGLGCITYRAGRIRTKLAFVHKNYEGWMTDIFGNNKDNTLTGTISADEIQGYAGNDLISGKSGDDNIFGGSGRDNLYGGYGNDNLNGGSGDDFLSGGKGDDRLEGGAGSDTLVGGGGDDLLFSEYGGDILRGGAGNDVLVMHNIADSMVGKMYGGDGDDLFLTSSFHKYNIFEVEGEGFDTLQITRFDLPEISLPAAVEKLKITLDVFALSEDAYTIIGNSSPNKFAIKFTRPFEETPLVIFGKGGRDKITGGDLADKLNGGPG